MNFFDACNSGQIDQVRNVIQQEPTAVSKVNEHGRTGLMCAVYNGHVALTTLLLNSGALVNAVEPTRNYTSLHFAVGRGFLDIVSVLLQHSANINAAGNDGMTPLYLAVSIRNLDIVRKLVESNADMNIVCSPLTMSPLQFSQQHSPDIYTYFTSINNTDDTNTDDEEGNESEESEEEGENDEEDEENYENDGDDEDEDCEGDNIEEENITESQITGSGLNPNNNPAIYFCGQCSQPLEDSIFVCKYGNHFLCQLCYTKRMSSLPDGHRSCLNTNCTGKVHTEWNQDIELQNKLIPLLQNCSLGCGKRFVLALKRLHSPHCYAGEQKCMLCNNNVSHVDYAKHLESSCLNGFQRIDYTLILTPSHPQYLRSDSVTIQLEASNRFYRFTFSGTDTQYPHLILGIHPSNSKNGWQVWITLDTSHFSDIVTLPSSLSTKFTCTLSHNYDGVGYQFSIPISPIGYTKWALVPGILLSKKKSLPVDISMVGFKV